MKLTKTVKTLAWLLVCAIPMLSQAHTALKESTPGDGVTVNAAPGHIDLVFNGPVRLIKFDLKASEHQCPTSFAVQSDAIATYRIETPDTHVGQYTAEWAAIGADGHTVTNTFSFTVEPNAAAN